MRFFLKISLASVISVFFISCDKNRVFEENTEIPGNVWKMENRLKFEVNITDTVSSHNFYINIRNSDSYPYSNLFLFVTTRFPNGKFARDTVECTLADESGKWLGDGLGDLWDNKILFKQGARFPLAGKYEFEFEQAMRVEDLPLIVDAGLRIEKAQ